MITKKDYSKYPGFEFLYDRDPESHKGDYGHALLIAGSYGKIGAAVLATRACMRSGVGLLTVHVPRCGVSVLQTAVPEAMLSIDADDSCFTSVPKNLERYDAVAIGPGIGTEEQTIDVLLRVLEALKKQGKGKNCKLILDADALNILSVHPEAIHLAEGAVITPHAGEYARLFADSDPQAMADIHGLTIVMKSHKTTIYSPSLLPKVNDTGNAGMATAGSGDVLTGVTLGIAAQKVAYSKRHPSRISNNYEENQQIAAMSVYMHGAAGDIAAKKRSQYALIASDIIDEL
ncbi:MAG: NAD(P)H-hydrate dehydratase [Bacteroidales bacterium]|nr:NAD(P)H-hydrate dehydratase [Bacteroidales bacterium]